MLVVRPTRRSNQRLRAGGEGARQRHIAATAWIPRLAPPPDRPPRADMVTPIQSRQTTARKPEADANRYHQLLELISHRPGIPNHHIHEPSASSEGRRAKGLLRPAEHPTVFTKTVTGRDGRVVS